MKISELIAYLQKYQTEFGDSDINVDLSDAMIMPDGTIPPKSKVAPIGSMFDQAIGHDSQAIGWTDLAYNSVNPRPVICNPKNFSWKDDEEKLNESDFAQRYSLKMDTEIMEYFKKTLSLIDQ